MTRTTILGLALALAFIGSIVLIFGASQQSLCNPAGAGCTQINYTPVYFGIAIIVGSAGIAIASSRTKTQITNQKSKFQQQ